MDKLTPDGKGHRHIDWNDLKLIPRVVYLELPKENIRIGNALFLHNNAGQAILWHVYVKPEYRRTKVAAQIIEAAKVMFYEILTDWETEEGEKMCEFTGFKKSNSDDLRFVWKREKTKVQLIKKGLV